MPQFITVCHINVVCQKTSLNYDQETDNPQLTQVHKANKSVRVCVCLGCCKAAMDLSCLDLSALHSYLSRLTEQPYSTYIIHCIKYYKDIDIY